MPDDYDDLLTPPEQFTADDMFVTNFPDRGTTAEYRVARWGACFVVAPRLKVKPLVINLGEVPEDCQAVWAVEQRRVMRRSADGVWRAPDGLLWSALNRVHMIIPPIPASSVSASAESQTPGETPDPYREFTEWVLRPEPVVSRQHVLDKAQELGLLPEPPSDMVRVRLTVEFCRPDGVVPWQIHDWLQRAWARDRVCGRSHDGLHVVVNDIEIGLSRTDRLVYDENDRRTS